MVSFPPCKINLGLSILSKRPDGYHNLETCFYPVPWTDILEIIRSDDFSFSVSGIPVTGALDDNLVVRAYRLLQRDFDLGSVQIHLHKIVPMGAGLGGGSSDAAHALLILNSIFSLNLSIDALKRYALTLGSDCPFFITDKPMMGTGRGELLREASISLKGKYLVIVKPNIHISTAEAYAGIKPKQPEVSLETILSKDFVHWRDSLLNDFETSLFTKHPELSIMKNKLYDAGAVYASMSGSGSSVYGIFNQEIDLRSTFAGITYWSGLL